MYKNKKGFTLIEMLIVLMIISVLIILIVPTLSHSSKDINKKGCVALVTVVQSQVHLYELDKGKLPSNLQTLVDGKYIKEEQTKCSNGIDLDYSGGIVSLAKGTKE